MHRLNRHITISLSILLITTGIVAQGSDGRSDSVASKRSDSFRSIRRPTRPPKRSVSEDLSVIRTGRLSIVVNEGSRIFLSQLGSLEQTELTTNESSAPSLIIRTLPVGSYKVVAKRPGFFDEVRVVEIYADKRRKIVVNLRPQMALLTINTNLADAEIDVGGVGRFTGSLKKHFVKPGKYNVTVQRRGYVAQSTVVNLSMAGREQNLSMILQPLRIDSVLASASERLSARDLEAAKVLVNDILLLNPNHARANRIYGQILTEKGDPAATESFVRAINGGESVPFSVKLLDSGKLVEVELRIHKDGVSVRSEKRVDLNFSLKRADVSEFNRSNDPESITHLVLRGRSDFYGRPISPNLTIYSPLAAIDQDTTSVGCSSSRTGHNAGAGRSCVSDIEILRALITTWLAS